MKRVVLDLIEEHQSRDPFEIADNLGIIVLFEPLGTINGYYNTAFRQKFIHINCDIPEYRMKFTAAHELGHALLHPTANTPFMKERTYMSVDKLEIEANKFAVNLLISDEDLEEYKELTIGQVARIYGCHQNLIQLRLINHQVQGVQY
ncbi:MAG TPA: ImmA/IrrE family metallo-endopeptidase [Epulopiscium sp.]|nr:ImmA/IrrE family metallo-endopeptidase [Candidatus Epulonipiscium sp.]